MRPIFSIVMPMFNSEQTIRVSINSVRFQTEKNWELIIIDDFSTDSSIQIVKEIQADDSRIKLLEMKANSGPGVARNRGLNVAQGRYICFLDSDDEWFPIKLEAQKKYMMEKDIAFCAAQYLIRSGNGKLKQKSIPSVVHYQDLLKENVIGCLTVCYDASKVGKRIMPELRKRQDYGLWLQILRDGWVCHIMSEPIAIYNVRKGSVSSNPLANIYFHYALFRTELMMSPWASCFRVLVNILQKIRSSA